MPLVKVSLKASNILFKEDYCHVQIAFLKPRYTGYVLHVHH
ncbi:hypothetical protein N39L_30790 [Limnospira platensis NIES-39]|nr:hypothetical protein N39L_30710 [Arthrospira platensis NIES-39]BDT13352.1 hypothetical protein N39L_30750 [Arthrospira platensis NIES-39]BDT13356.1 hypothetical protein N39L_30790 [Arthrospira platensis NIES-39]